MSQATLGEAPYRNSNLFTNYYLDNRVQSLDQWNVDDEAEVAFERLRSLWKAESDLLGSYGEDELLDVWIDEVLDELGYATLSETTLPDGGGYTDRLLFDSREVRAEAARRRQNGETEAMFGSVTAVLEAKQWDASFTERFSEQRSYRDASHQIKHYLEHTPEATEWGILTNGRQWRLYGTKDYATETYYEVNLPELLERGDLEAFKYFYTFFRPTAFADAGGSTFLDTVWNESETAAQELGEDLQDSVFTALRVLAEGFVETNNLDIDPDNDERLAELKEQSLVYLYRLMFVLYAESRRLLDPEDLDKRAEYRENFGLNQLRREVYESVSEGRAFDDFSHFSTSYWSRLDDLFGLIDTGEAELDVPPYNGGLFDADDHAFLANNEVADRYLAEVLYRIGTTEDTDGSDVLADYADLDTRHLGSIYEGLLEHEFRIAPEQYAAVAEDGGQVWQSATEVPVADAVETVEAGELYVVNDDGERKATGAYYTPDYVVTYIVEETVDPLLAKIDEDLRADGLEPSDREYFRRYWESVLDLTILDPAMGSGHFLTKATGYLTERVMSVVREQEIQGYDEQTLRREIAKECIYGVDVNGMAVELAKLSMWLETLATDKPLAFLDHHLKSGNSLVGSDIYEVLSDDDPEDGQLTLMQSLARVRDDTLAHVRELMEELVAIDNDDLASIKQMQATYDEIRSDPLYRRLFELANVHTAERFGLDVPAGAYETMAGAIETESEWTNEVVNEDWFVSAQAMANEEQFFHWELEFPEVFLGEGIGSGGFDAVVANPPYVSNWELTETDESLPEKLESLYPEVTYGHWDLFVPFTYKIVELAHAGGNAALITPNSLGTEKYGKKLRKYLIQQNSLDQLVQFYDHSVFNDVDRQYLISLVSPEGEGSDCEVVNYDGSAFQFENKIDSSVFLNYSNATFRLDIAGEEQEIKQKIEEQSIKLGHLCVVNPGVVAHSASDSPLDFDKADVISEEPDEGSKKYISGGDIYRYRTEWNVKYMDYDAKREHFHRPKYPELFDSPKIMFSGISGESSLIRSCYDEEQYYTNHNVLHAALLEGDILDHHSSQDYEIADNATDYELKYIAALVNSKLVTFYFKRFLATGTLQGTYSSMYPEDIRKLPVNESFSESCVVPDTELELSDLEAEPDYQTVLSHLTDRMRGLNDDLAELNTHVLDYLGSYTDGQTLADVGFTQPPENAAESILQETTEQRPNLRVGDCDVDRESEHTVTIHLAARYKPDESGNHDDADPEEVGTDRWGYRTTELLPALRITDLTETEADLIEAFIPHAVDKANGFANFRETATKTNSLVDRLRKLTLPRVADVEQGLTDYREAVARADELEKEIERTDELIDEIVYDLYELTDEEIEIVEESVGD